MIRAAEQEQAQHFLSLRMPNDVQALLATQNLVEVFNLTSGQIVPIPDMLSSMMGICNWRGEILWLVDLGCLLGLEPLFAQEYYQSSFNVIVVRHQGESLGLVVSQVGQMLLIEVSQIQSISAASVTSEMAFALKGYWVNKSGKMMLILDGQAIVEFFGTQKINAGER